MDTFEQNDKQKKEKISKQRQITRKRFSKNRNAFSESIVSSLKALYKMKETVKKIAQSMINYIFQQLQTHQKEETEE